VVLRPLAVAKPGPCIGNVRLPLVSVRPGQVPLATRTLLHDRVRLVISVGGIGFAILLILILRGIMDGTVARSTTYIDHSGADVFVAHEGVTHMMLAASFLPESVVPELAACEGVAAAAGILRFNVIVSTTHDLPAAAIGYGPEGLGGPWQLKSGRDVTAADEAVVDSDLAAELGVSVGSTIRIANQPFRVVGTSSGTSAIAGKIVFLRREALQALTGSTDRVNFVLLRLKPGVSAPAFASAVSAAVPGISALTRSDLRENDRSLIGALFVSPIDVMSTAGFLVGIAIVGLTMYTTTAERLRDFGVLKAIGASDTYMFRTVATEAIVLCLTGYLLGFAATRAAGPIVTHFVPDIGVGITLFNATRAFIAVMVMSLVGAIVPIARILRVDPLVVFHR